MDLIQIGKNAAVDADKVVGIDTDINGAVKVAVNTKIGVRSYYSDFDVEITVDLLTNVTTYSYEAAVLEDAGVQEETPQDKTDEELKAEATGPYYYENSFTWPYSGAYGYGPQDGS